MKAAVFLGKGKIQIVQKDIREVGADELLINVKACGVCGTDVHIYNGSAGSAPVIPPVVLGHEYSGIVVKAGNKVKNIVEGDRVAIDPNMFCGKCYFCRTGLHHLCENLTALGVNIDGGFAEYCIVPASQAYTFPEAITYEEAAMVEPLACCLHGIDRIGIKAGQRVAILGGGAIGLLMLQLAKLQGASFIAVSEPIAGRRQLAAGFGADLVIDPLKEDIDKMIRQNFCEGVDAAIECAGVEKSFIQALQVARRGGTVMYFSVAPVEATAGIRPYEIFQKELTITGSFINPGTHGRAMSLIVSGKVDVKPLITHRYELEEIDTAIKMHKSPETVKIVIRP